MPTKPFFRLLATFLPSHSFARRGGPVLIDAVVNRTELPSINVEMAKAFSVKAIMNGQADQVIGLAKTNLWL
jgi:hypothetical protein